MKSVVRAPLIHETRVALLVQEGVDTVSGNCYRICPSANATLCTKAQWYSRPAGFGSVVLY